MHPYLLTLLGSYFQVQRIVRYFDCFEGFCLYRGVCVQWMGMLDTSPSEYIVVFIIIYNPIAETMSYRNINTSMLFSFLCFFIIL